MMLKSTDVNVINKDPLEVKIASPVPLLPDPKVQDQFNNPSRPAETTFQQDLTTDGQRKINLIWEYTQAIIALIVVIATMSAGMLSAYYGLHDNIPTILGVAFGTVVGFYFSRTNHAAIGGVGIKPQEPYVGR